MPPPKTKTILGIKLLSVSNVATMLGVSTKTINRAIEAKSIGAKRIGQSWYISESNLREYIERSDNLSDDDDEAELVAKAGLSLEPGWEYYVDETTGNVCRMTDGVVEEVARTELGLEDGWDYVVGEDGDIWRYPVTGDEDEEDSDATSEAEEAA